MKKYSNFYLGFLILLFLTFFIISLHNFISFLISIDTETIQTEILSKVVPSLLGAFFSGIVAFLIFYLTKLKDEIAKRNQSKMYLEIIENEIQSNLISVNELSEIILNTPPEDLAKLFSSGSKVQEQFKVLTSNLSIEMIDKYLVQLNKTDYLIIAKHYKNFNSLLISLELLNNEIEVLENRVLLLKRLKMLFEFFKVDNGVLQDQNNSKNIPNWFIQIFLILLYSVINILILHFFM